MRLILIRHGNTFSPTDTPTIVGCTEDLPLVETGKAQAHLVGQSLLTEALHPHSIFCGTLKRTRETAKIIAETMKLGILPHSDDRLTELDYGDWAGLTADEVRSRFGNDEFEAWEKRAIMPQCRKWTPSEDHILQNLHKFIDEISGFPSDSIILAITSNGLLRFFSKLVDGLFDELTATNNLKVATGHMCRFDLVNETFKMVYWNRNPKDVLSNG